MVCHSKSSFIGHKGGVNAVCSGPLDTSLIDTNMDALNSKNEFGEDIE